MKALLYKIKNVDFIRLIEILWCYVISLLAIISTGSIWSYDDRFSFTESGFIIYMQQVAMLGFFTFLILNRKVFLSSIDKMKILAIGAALYGYSKFAKINQNEYETVFMMTIFWLILAFAMLDDKSIIWDAFINVALAIACISLVFWLFGSMIGLIPPSGTTSHAWGSWGDKVNIYYEVYFEGQTHHLTSEYVIVRNTGVFTEGPMFSAILSVALAAEVFLKEKFKIWKVAVLSVTILTTMSTTGTIVIFLAVFFKWYSIIQNKENSKKQKIIFYSICLAGALIVGVLFVVKMMTSSGGKSVNIRYDHLVACISKFIESPIFGQGYKNIQAILYESDYFQGLSVGLPYFLAFGGIILGATIFVPYIFAIMKAVKNKDCRQLFFQTLFLVMFFFTAVSTRGILMLYIAYIAICDYEALLNLNCNTENEVCS